jgi:hypothetical protein
MRAEGSRLRGSFYVFPNILQGRPTNLQGIARDCDLGMYENSVGTYGTHPWAHALACHRRDLRRAHE